MSDSMKTAHEVMAEIRQRYADEPGAAALDSKKREEKAYRRYIGGKGGSVSKRNPWAQQVAEFLADEFSGYSFKEVWTAIPESSEPLYIEGDEHDLEVYRDGKRVIIKDAHAPTELGAPTYDTFEKKYFRPARNTGT